MKTPNWSTTKKAIYLTMLAFAVATTVACGSTSDNGNTPSTYNYNRNTVKWT